METNLSSAIDECFEIFVEFSFGIPVAPFDRRQELLKTENRVDDERIKRDRVSFTEAMSKRRKGKQHGRIILSLQKGHIHLHHIVP